MNSAKICKALEGKIRGQAVAIASFDTTPPPGFHGMKVDPCQILRHAMDDGKAVYFDRHHHDCTHGAFITGVEPGNEQIRTGRLLTDYIPAYNLEAAHGFNSGEYVLPQGTVAGFCAAPLDDVPAGVVPGWIAIVCTPGIAALLGAVRAVKDGTRPDTAAGNSFCSDLFVTPFLNDNVIVTTGDMGGRMNNKLRESEMFVIIPTQWADGIPDVLETPDVKGIYEATRPADSPYFARQKEKAEKAEHNQDPIAIAARKDHAMALTMPWDEQAVAAVARAPKFIRSMAVNNVEEFAAEHNHDRVTLAVVEAQAESAGMSKFLKAGGAEGGWLKRLFRR